MKYAFSLLVVFFFYSCDPVYEVDFNIINESSETLVIVSQETEASAVDTSNLIVGNSITLYRAFGNGMSSADYAASLEVIPFNLLEITTESGKEFMYEEVKVENWLLKPGDSKSDRFFSLPVIDQDF